MLNDNNISHQYSRAVDVKCKLKLRITKKSNLAISFKMAIAFIGVLMQNAQTHSQEVNAITASKTIYPGDIIRSDMVRAMAFDGAPNRQIIFDIDKVIGKVARRTLLVGRVISVDAISDPLAIANGGLVQVTYADGGVMISVSAQALHSASIGDSIRVRNIDSGLVITGVVMSDGTVRVGG